MAITPLPTPPSRDDPANFASRGDAFLGALPTFATEANALAVQVNANAVSAATDADDALAAANAAVASANATKWISGTSYTQGAVVWSPITFLTYRRKTTGSGTTDPSSDATNWAQAAGTGNLTVTTSGTAGQLLTSQGGGNPTWTTIAPAGTITGTASGSISSGAPVAVNINGTFSSVTGQAQVLGSISSIDQTLTGSSHAVVHDSTSGKSVLFRISGSANCTCYVLTTNATTGAITSSSAINFSGASVNPDKVNAVAIGNSKILVYMRHGANYQTYFVVGTISGSTISFGSIVAGGFVTYDNSDLVYNPLTDSCLWASGNSPLVGRVITVSGTSITINSAVTIDTGSGATPKLAYDSINQKIVCFYKQGQSVVNAGFTYGSTACFLTISGTTFTVGTKTVQNDGGSSQAGTIDIAYNATTGVMYYLYNVYSGAYIPMVQTSTQTSTTITFGTSVSVSGKVGNDYSSWVGGVTYVPDNGNVYLTGGVSAQNGYLGYHLLTTASGVTTVGTTVIVNSLYPNQGNSFSQVAWNSTAKKIIRGFYENSSYYINAIAFNPPFSNFDTFIGFSNASYTNGQTATVGIIGYSSATQTGLSVGKKYYVQENGTLSLTPASSQTVYAGVTLSATTMLVKG